MAGLALASEFAAVFIIASVAGDTGCGCVLVVFALVAGAALHVQVLAHQRILRFAVIKPYLLPALRDMTGCAVLAERTLVGVLLAVTTNTVRRCFAKLSLRLVALLALNFLAKVLADQFEIRF